MAIDATRDVVNGLLHTALARLAVAKKPQNSKRKLMIRDRGRGLTLFTSQGPFYFRFKTNMFPTVKQRMFVFTLCGLFGLVVLWGTLSKHSAAQRELAIRATLPGPNRKEVEAPSSVNTTMQDPREQLQTIAQRRGVPLDVLTQEAKIQLSNLQNAMSKAVNGPIEFYGEVRDENEHPMEGANIYLGCVVFPDAHVRTNVATNARGAFSVNGLTGAILTVQLKKAGYKENSTNQSSFTYYSGLAAGGFTADKSNPVIFHMEKLH